MSRGFYIAESESRAGVASRTSSRPEIESEFFAKFGGFLIWDPRLKTRSTRSASRKSLQEKRTVLRNTGVSSPIHFPLTYLVEVILIVEQSTRYVIRNVTLSRQKVLHFFFLDTVGQGERDDEKVHPFRIKRNPFTLSDEDAPSSIHSMTRTIAADRLLHRHHPE